MLEEWIRKEINHLQVYHGFSPKGESPTGDSGLYRAFGHPLAVGAASQPSASRTGQCAAEPEYNGKASRSGHS